MNSRFLHFLCVLACAALIGLGPARAQKVAGTDSNGSAVTAPAHHADASHTAVAPGSTANGTTAATRDSQDAAHAAIANDRGTVPQNRATSSRFNVGWIGLAGLLGLLGLVRRSNSRSGRHNVAEREAEIDRERDDSRRAA